MELRKHLAPRPSVVWFLNGKEKGSFIIEIFKSSVGVFVDFKNPCSDSHSMLLT